VATTILIPTSIPLCLEDVTEYVAESIFWQKVEEVTKG
jgi:hypothetical protein